MATAEAFPALACAGNALAHLKAHWRDALRLGWPWYGAAIVLALLVPGDGPASALPRLAALLAAAVLGAAWCRHVLAEERRAGPAPLDRAALAVLAWKVVLGVLVLVPVASVAALRPVAGAAMPFLTAAALLFGTWAAARLALAVPLAATGEGIGAAARAWLLAARAGWRLPFGWVALLFALFAVSFLAVAVIGSVEGVFRGPGTSPDPRIATAAGLLVQWAAVPALVGYAALAVRELGAQRPAG